MDLESEEEKAEEGMLPGFRFHPTDEELVGFYLKRKVQKRAVSIELIRQLDIYKYDPWDLPKLAVAGEKEWYFYCPRDRKYRNSARPNRVTGAGFWKATGTDRAIYTADGATCIGLKKSLVFYRGRAAKGIKTDWMMHEYRLPPYPPRNTRDKDISPNDSWAICRIFKKTCSASQRSFSHSWASSIPPVESSDPYDIISLPTESGNAADEPLLFSGSSIDINPTIFTSSGLASSLTLPQTDMLASSTCSLDVAALFQCIQPQFVADAEKDFFPSSSSSSSADQMHHRRHQQPGVQALSIDLLLEMTGNLGRGGEMGSTKKCQKNPEAASEENRSFGDDSQWGTLAAAVLPFARPRSRLWERGLPSLLE